MKRFVTLSALALLAACKSSTSPASGCSPSGTVACVTIQDFSFSPATLTIKVGTTVQWSNNGPSQHTTTSDAATWNSGTLNPPMGGGPYGGGSAGGSYSFTFNSTGTYGYHCSLHPPSVPAYAAFTGTITVTQ